MLGQRWGLPVQDVGVCDAVQERENEVADLIHD